MPLPFAISIDLFGSIATIAGGQPSRHDMDLGLEGKTALVTGASIGIGRGIALALAREGVRLAVVARRANLLEELSGEIVAAGGAKPIPIVENLMAEGSPARIAKAALEGLASVDILINNAGGSRAFKL